LCSPPLGGVQQPDYCNAVVMAHCRLRPLPLLARLQAIETAAGRVRHADEVWASRPLDLDILKYGNETIVTPTLRVPHPGIADRAFVVQAWLMLDPHAALPDGTRLAALPSAAPPLLPLWQPALDEHGNSRIIERSPSH
ncbi:MAG: 2-amino-4-hydroxy-6-hydroxymethyldihydropteridine diphosphokinase, partial [Oceanococcaceae bacterium]